MMNTHIAVVCIASTISTILGFMVGMVIALTGIVTMVGMVVGMILGTQATMDGTIPGIILGMIPGIQVTMDGVGLIAHGMDTMADTMVDGMAVGGIPIMEVVTSLKAARIIRTLVGLTEEPVAALGQAIVVLTTHRSAHRQHVAQVACRLQRPHAQVRAQDLAVLGHSRALRPSGRLAVVRQHAPTRPLHRAHVQALSEALVAVDSLAVVAHAPVAVAVDTSVATDKPIRV